MVHYRSPSNRRAQRKYLRKHILRRVSRFDAVRLEWLRLHGYYEEKETGRCFSKSEAEIFFGRDDKRLIVHLPETVTDYINSIGEVDVPSGKHYPLLGIHEGEVIRDPKVKLSDPLCPTYVHPVLRGSFDYPPRNP